jgi:hypothetical protein
VPTIYEQLRGSLLGSDDLPTLVQRLAPDGRDVEPWSLFVAATNRLAAGDRAGAVVALRTIVDGTDVETRVHLLAWHALRSLGIEPPLETAGHVRGVIVEVGLDGGTDVVTAYEDHTARYFNHGGGAIVWETPGDAEIDGLIDAYLAAGQAVAEVTGPFDQPLPPPALAGTATILLLTDAGIHLGAGPVDAIMSDALGGQVTAAALSLMNALIERSGG